VEIDHVSEQQARRRILDALSVGQGGNVVTVNLDHLVRCRRQSNYRDLVARASLVVADGMPLVWASRIQGTPLPERVAGSTMSLNLGEDLGRAGKRLFLLGGNPGVAEEAAVVLIDQYPGLFIAGTHCPPFGFEENPGAMEAIRNALRTAQPDVVYVALGSPKQEKLIDRLRAEMPELSGAWWLGVGISLSFITGEIERAPLWMQRVGLEWAYRLAQEPKRLFRRYLIDGIPSACLLLTRSAMHRFGGQYSIRIRN